MRVHPRLFALLSLAAVPIANAELTGVFATTFLVADTYVEIEGESHAGPTVELPFSLAPMGSVDDSIQSSAGIPNADATATSGATGSFTSTSDSLELNMFSSASSSLDARASDTFGVARARSATVVGFTTDEHVRVTLTGDASIALNLHGLAMPVELPTLIDVVRVGGGPDPVFELESPSDPFAVSFLLAPGQFRLRMAVDTTFQTFGFPENLYTADAQLSVFALIEPVPAPGTIGIVSLALGFGTARRSRA